MAELNVMKILTEMQRNKSSETMDTKIILSIMAKLAETISLRAGQASPAYLRLMSERLSKENYDYVIHALKILEERERGEGETTLLDLATILKEIRRLTPKPKTLYEIEEEQIEAERTKARLEAAGE